VRKGSVNLCKLLLNYNANMNIKDRYGKTPMDYAIKENNAEILELLNLKKLDNTK